MLDKFLFGFSFTLLFIIIILIIINNQNKPDVKISQNIPNLQNINTINDNYNHIKAANSNLLREEIDSTKYLYLNNIVLKSRNIMNDRDSVDMMRTESLKILTLIDVAVEDDIVTNKEFSVILEKFNQLFEKNNFNSIKKSSLKLIKGR